MTEGVKLFKSKECYREFRFEGRYEKDGYNGFLFKCLRCIEKGMTDTIGKAFINKVGDQWKFVHRGHKNGCLKGNDYRKMKPLQ